MVWLFPIEAFNSFRSIYILTYDFQSQLQKYYYDYYNLEYTYWSIDGDAVDEYTLVPYDNTRSYIKYDYSKLIHICDLEKLNMIGGQEHRSFKIMVYSESR